MGNQGHNKGDKASGGRFKEVALTPATPPSPTVAKKKTVAKAKKVSTPVDYSAWEPPRNLEETSKDLWDSMNGSRNLDLDLYTRALARKVLPDLSDATDDEMLVLRKRLLEIARLSGGYRFSEFANIIRSESIMRGQSDLGTDGVSDTKIAVERLEENIRDQEGATYSAQELFNIRLEGVQEDLADPTAWNVTVKVPSGYEIAVSKPDARAILISMKIKPASTKAYIPLWPKNEGSNQ